jgi:hypothetical protein
MKPVKSYLYAIIVLLTIACILVTTQLPGTKLGFLQANWDIDKTSSHQQDKDENPDYAQLDFLSHYDFWEPLPWGNDEGFIKSIEEVGANVIMAKFKATLDDPLPGEMYNVSHAADRLAGTVIAPGKTFSQNRTLGPYTVGNGYKSGPIYQGTRIGTASGGGVCKIATLLYNIAVLSNLPVLERTNHSMTVPYVPPGQDGYIINSKIIIRYSDGKTEEKKMGRSYYNALPEIIEKGP